MSERRMVVGGRLLVDKQELDRALKRLAESEAVRRQLAEATVAYMNWHKDQDRRVLYRRLHESLAASAALDSERTP